MLEDKSIDVAGVIPYDPTVFEAGFKGQAISRGKALRAAEHILKGFLSRTSS